MILFISLIAIGVAYTMMIHVRNRQRDRARHRRERYEEMQEKLLHTLRKNKDGEKEDGDVEL